MAKFTNEACVTGGVSPFDSLLFMCKVYEATLLRVVFPTGDMEIVSVGDTVATVDLPPGFTAVSLDIKEIDDSRRSFHLNISIDSASRLNGGEIKCDDTTLIKKAGAGCPIIGKFHQIHYSVKLISSYSSRLCFA